MEGRKEVMLAGATSAANTAGGGIIAGPPAGGAAIMFAAPPPVSSKFDNYKGILLCDRPSDGSSKMSQSQGAPSNQQKVPFLPPGAVDDPVSGLQPSLEALKRRDFAKKNYTHKKQVNSVQLAHRKMIRNLEEEKMKQRLDLAEQQLEEEMKKQHFREAQQKIREALREGTSTTSEASNEPGSVAQATAIAATISKKDPRQALGIVDTLSEGRAGAEDVAQEADEDERVGRGHTPPLPTMQGVQLPEIPAAPVSYVKAGSEDKVAAAPASSSGQDGGSAKSQKKKPKKAKPKWAMTEEEALEAELKDTDDLVQFAANLDFEKYVDDYEVKEALSIMRQRVEELKSEHEPPAEGEEGQEGEPDQEEADTSTALLQQVPRRSSKQSGLSAKDLKDDTTAQDRLREHEWDNMSTYSALSEKKRQALSNEALGLAERILASSTQLRMVYSKASLAKVLEELTRKAYNQDRASTKSKAPTKAGTREEDSLAALAAKDPSSVCQPKIVTQDPHDAHQAGGRVLLQLKNSRDYVQNLPYLYRCPSI